MIKLEAQLTTPSASSGGKIEKTLQKDAGIINTLSPGSLGKGTKLTQLGLGFFYLFWVLALSEIQLYLFVSLIYFLEQF